MRCKKVKFFKKLLTAHPLSDIIYTEVKRKGGDKMKKSKRKNGNQSTPSKIALITVILQLILALVELIDKLLE